MPTATYEDFTARYPDATASRRTVEAFLEDVAAEISARCIDKGMTYAALVESREGLVRRIECTAVYRICGRTAVDGVDQTGLSSFSQTVGDHRWEYGYSSSGGKNLLLNDEWKALGLSGQRIGWLGVPWADDDD